MRKDNIFALFKKWFWPKTVIMDIIFEIVPKIWIISNNWSLSSEISFSNSTVVIGIWSINKPAVIQTLFSQDICFLMSFKTFDNIEPMDEVRHIKGAVPSDKTLKDSRSGKNNQINVLL